MNVTIPYSNFVSKFVVSSQKKGSIVLYLRKAKQKSSANWNVCYRACIAKSFCIPSFAFLAYPPPCPNSLLPLLLIQKEKQLKIFHVLQVKVMNSLFCCLVGGGSFGALKSFSSSVLSLTSTSVDSLSSSNIILMSAFTRLQSVYAVTS